jgi:formiminoglutamase
MSAAQPAADRPFDPSQWLGRSDADEPAGAQRWHQRVRSVPDAPPSRPGIAIFGFCSDAGVRRNLGRPGAAAGPSSLRRMLGNVPIADDATPVDAGDVVVDGDALEAAQQRYAQLVQGLLARGYRPIGLGGGHEIAWGGFGGLAAALAAARPAPGAAPRVGIVNLDAHFDLRAGSLATSGTPFRQVADWCAKESWPFRYCVLGVSRFANTGSLFDRARALGVLALTDEELGPTATGRACEALRAFLAGVDHAYLTVCLDVLPPDLAPGVSAPSARGVELDVVEPLIDLVAGSGKLRLADVAELNPSFDVDHRTARVAARLVARIAAGWA